MKKLILILLVFSMVTFAQESAEVKPIELSKLDRLELSGLMKDLLIANQQIRLLETAHKEAVVVRDAKQVELQAAFAKLQAQYKAPADKFNFDGLTFSFVPIPEEAKEE